MRTKLFYILIFITSVFLAACGGSSSSSSNKSQNNKINLTESKEGYYIAAQIALGYSVFWENFVGLNPETLANEIEDERGHLGECQEKVTSNTEFIFEENLVVTTCSEEIKTDAFKLHGTKVTGIEFGNPGKSLLGYFALHGDSPTEKHFYEDENISTRYQMDLSIEASEDEAGYRSERKYFVSYALEESNPQYTHQELKLGMLGAPFEVSIQEDENNNRRVNVEGALELAMQKGNTTCQFSINSVKTVKAPILKFIPDNDSDSLDVEEISNGKLQLDGNSVTFNNNGDVEVNNVSIDMAKVEQLLDQCEDN